jgi:hypothetical protein
MPAATAAQKTAMATQVAELERQFAAGLVRQGLANAASVRGLVLGPILANIPLFQSEEAERTAKEMAGIQENLNTWRDKWKKWAERGTRDDGSLYPISMWSTFGQELGRRVESATGEAWNQSVFALASFTVENTAAATKEVTDAVTSTVKRAAAAVGAVLPTGEDLDRAAFWLKVGTGVVVVVALGYAVRSVAVAGTTVRALAV